jgi:hypothetical protein
MRIACRTLLYGLVLFIAFYGAIMLGVTIEALFSIALTGHEDIQPNTVTVLAGCLAVGLLTAIVLEDL